ncbi:MAG: hypothetical protein FRX48_06485 [Lasallia pustulata]|uniref:Uncharacterized protein n=1 Tax=Lasallia pustulata TaxID=136370 RepID=A0A5M8PLT8_9LECA|nr:MAG: hypothetical protein FRX48_06485 [Lasallia pustulata]
MLPFILGVPISTCLASVFASKLKVPIILLFALGCVLQTVGTALMSTLPVDTSPRTHGFEVTLGVGLGLNIGSVVIITPNLFQDKHQCLLFCPMISISHSSNESSSGHHGSNHPVSAFGRCGRPSHRGQRSGPIGRSTTSAVGCSSPNLHSDEHTSRGFASDCVQNILRWLQFADESYDRFRSSADTELDLGGEKEVPASG